MQKAGAATLVFSVLLQSVQTQHVMWNIERSVNVAKYMAIRLNLK